MKLTKIEGIKVKYKIDEYFYSISHCPFNYKKERRVGDNWCRYCEKHIAINILKQFVICKGKENERVKNTKDNI